MNRKIQVHRVVSKFGAFLWAALGLVTIYSIVNGVSGYAINLIMGIIFAVIGFYLYKKSKNITIILTEIVLGEGLTPTVSSHYQRFASLEIIFALISLFLGLAFLAGGVSRTFFEHLPIFG